MLAAGTYIRTLRDALDMSRAEVAALAGTHESQIVRIESGKQDSGYSTVFAVVEAVKGNALHVKRLVLSENATVEDGRTLAHKWLSARDMADIQSDIQSMSREELLELIELRDRLRGDPRALDHWINGLPGDPTRERPVQRIRQGFRRKRRAG